jgi:hypothetical protein
MKMPYVNIENLGFLTVVPLPLIFRDIEYLELTDSNVFSNQSKLLALKKDSKGHFLQFPLMG